MKHFAMSVVLILKDLKVPFMKFLKIIFNCNFRNSNRKFSFIIRQEYFRIIFNIILVLFSIFKIIPFLKRIYYGLQYKNT